jgi:hypothetical protein
VSLNEKQGTSLVWIEGACLRRKSIPMLTFNFYFRRVGHKSVLLQFLHNTNKIDIEIYLTSGTSNPSSIEQVISVAKQISERQSSSSSSA